ncbi:MAG: cysteine--tRNA ligase [Candidatus Doudnabacteria bacterium RIFCSPLOWO2_02_FULL_48_8]|uniref:Cysteine--tRNA ligase n=1 Tax=Candidatus Doudnabacteria bacterium RIFCSPHIGHO2_01_FULL_46_24 TaxID=1817825 RepID=A0A1F5NUN2_9BACT|nr:MAG: cysteine--tRNA ligase [Candidatus Doudnabacteria bacterium RIFCSPHIGHO2_01_FULL_46_24]OGE94211.1 MAG: cysteine--tRNA ligase [Candidatus Doudnabacteria bacterium RIFCSPHIGHO2_12_FULL_48_11]OGE95429.1 MAG: cysteine--tRNA ligase [Candidatus Doudnabacteria bacterium RIFCSPLOWO2_02_FULL_48_8]
MLKFYNSLTRKLEEFKPIKKDSVALYTCGPTVYNYAHIGNLRTNILYDLLRKTLTFNGYKIKHVLNITDVGHLTSDADTGEDKMEKNASTKDEVFGVAKKYTDAFLENLQSINIQLPDVMPKASEHIAEQIEMIKTLMEKDFAYESDEAVYFDVAKFPRYNRLTGQKLEDMMLGARQEVVKDPKKKNAIDFVLWFKTVGRYQNHILRWPSPWGDGFPGWHIECSAMSKKYLGQPIDIHAGGIDLKFPHHTNEIAQSEAAHKKPLANFWMHGEHLLVDAGKMAKSEGNFLTLKDVTGKGYNPLTFRYLVLSAHYRTKLNFTWESLTAAQNALNNLYQEISSYEQPKVGCAEFEQRFQDAINDDLNTPKALAVAHDLIRSDYPGSAKLQSLLKFDQVLGLKLRETWEATRNIPEVVSRLIGLREEARKAKDFVRADELRQAIEKEGYLIEDTPDGYRIKKKF